jgi:hypothetical protein
VFTFAPNAVRILAVTAALVLASGISDASQRLVIRAASRSSAT